MQKIKYDERNYRKHSKKNKSIIKKSLEELDAGRSVVIDSEDCLVAGNGVYEQAQALKMPVRVVETDGSELVVVKRTDLKTADEKRKKLALADNAASDTSEFDRMLLLDDFTVEQLADFGINIPPTEQISGLEFTGVYYEPKNKPEIKIEDCFDTTKFDKKVEAIEAMNLPRKTKDALKVFAYRFIKIDFESIANYYAFNATDEERRAIERLRLVLVDDGIDGFIEDDMLRIYNLMLDENDDER